MQIRVVPGSGAAIYRQIADQVQRAVAAGELAVGDPLPSVRALAKELVVNPNTVAKAYAELVADGVLETQPGRGVFVTERRAVYSQDERLRRLDEALETAVNESIRLDFSNAEILERMSVQLDKLNSRGKQNG
ncbi:GntR family transcriptional regulator [Allorhodopirellula solitaria]|uniref:HTH-type transcriptional repressor YtrA n=1 Tax=Allorhodopirellula solitaria TaxID=2527987 RepID=A0A5C5YJR0_9BACT|nr:GntR family transcriptional regulator [Allorhodopirellula solitaria]TWT75133.1 HTH-type transcriptional repressor YtrA [Allorhodopirellula solitaria]